MAHASCHSEHGPSWCADGVSSAERLDASYDWLPAPPARSQPLVGFGNGCTDPPAL